MHNKLLDQSLSGIDRFIQLMKSGSDLSVEVHGSNKRRYSTALCAGLAMTFAMNVNAQNVDEMDQLALQNQQYANTVIKSAGAYKIYTEASIRGEAPLLIKIDSDTGELIGDPNKYSNYEMEGISGKNPIVLDIDKEPDEPVERERERVSG